MSPDLHFWSDTSAVGWGAHLDCQVASGLWAPNRQRCLSTQGNCSLFSWGFSSSGQLSKGRTVAVFCDYTTAVTSLHKEGGTWSPLLNTLAQAILRWKESLSIRLAPTVPSGLRQRPSRRPVSPSPAPTSRVVYTHDRLSGFEKPVAGSNSFFTTSATHRCSISFSPFRDPRSAGTDAFLQYWDGLPAYAFHPVAVIHVFSRSSGPPRGRNSLL